MTDEPTFRTTLRVPLLAVAAFVLLFAMVVFLGSPPSGRAQQGGGEPTSRGEGVDTNCAINIKTTCLVEASVTITNFTVIPASTCFASGMTVEASVGMTLASGVVQIATTYSNGDSLVKCPEDKSTNILLGPTILSNWWTIARPDGFETHGDSSNVMFTLSGCGCVTVAFTAVWAGVCDTNPRAITIASNIAIGGVEITPHSATGLANGCNPNPPVQFGLTNTCGDVDWRLVPDNIANGATISGGAVSIGSVATTYTIRATSKDNTNCFDEASLTVQLDCACSNHIEGVDRPLHSGSPLPLQCPWPGGWHRAPVTNRCAAMPVELYCDGVSVHLRIGGAEAGVCNYNGSEWGAHCRLCSCESVLMGTWFWVVGTNGSSPTYMHRKDTRWDCATGFTTSCSTVSTLIGLPSVPIAERRCDGSD